MRQRVILVCGVVCWFVASATALRAADDKSGIQYFEKHIRPVLVNKCFKCHSTEAKSLKGGYSVESREAIRAGGESGKAIVPGNIEDSVLIEALRHDGLEMPPGEKLPEDVILKFEHWIRIGAPDPRDGKAPARADVDLVKAREFWAFRPVSQPAVPTVKNSLWPKSVLDRFVLAKLEEKKLTPVGDAEPQKLVRRLYFDLIGLPPTPAEVEEFMSSAKKDRKLAIENLVDRLLASNKFGERWGRHWLDVVRFAESSGMERNFTFPQAWKYRDYVIDSFNNDQPFADFVRQQVAGDLLPYQSPEERRENFVATAFLALGPKSLNETNGEQFTMDIVDEQIDSTFRSFLGLTAGCARCHDHKFDPISMKEYYGLAGIFRSTETFYGTAAQQGNRHPGRLLAFHDGSIEPVRAGGGDNDKGKKKAAKPTKSPAPAPAPAPTSKPAAEIEAELAAARAKLAKLEPRIADAKKAQKAKLKANIDELTKQISTLTAQLNESKNSPTDAAAAADTVTGDTVPSSKRDDLLMAVMDAKQIGDTEIRLRGEPSERGAVVPRGFLTIASHGSVPAIAAKSSGRLELAEWLVHPNNPLLGRVAANRIWQHLFGRGIVASVDNFGVQSDEPTHPELLDWLALQFLGNGGSTKKLIREIVLSRTYQLAATGDLLADKADPEIKLLWRARHRRIEVEALRDSILVVSGQLDADRPDVGSIVATIGDGDIGRGINASRFANVGKKRSVYLPIVRTVLPEMLQLFDFPEPSNINGQRDVTTVPTQALYLMNSEFVLDQAEEFAKSILAMPNTTESARIQSAYLRALGRPASDEEELEARKFVTESVITLRSDAKAAETSQLKAWTAFCQALFASAEFRYIE